MLSDAGARLPLQAAAPAPGAVQNGADVLFTMEANQVRGASAGDCNRTYFQSWAHHLESLVVLVIRHCWGASNNAVHFADEIGLRFSVRPEAVQSMNFHPAEFIYTLFTVA